MFSYVFCVYSFLDICLKTLYNIRAMEKYQHVKQFQVKYCEADFKDELKLSTALSYMEEVACSSADELGFGYVYVKPKGYAFMVSGIYCEFEKPIHLGDIVTVKTWPTPPTFVVFGREYQMCNDAGEVLLNASSRWCLIDMATGKILQSKYIDNQDYSTYNTDKAVEVSSWKIPVFEPTEGVLKFTMTVANSEYDHNMHVNNTRYADYCLNCFSVKELGEQSLKSFAISYVRQCKEGQTLRFYLKKETDNAYLAHGFNEKNEIVVQSRVVFKERK